MKRRIIIGALVAGLLAGLAPIGGSQAVASDCNSPIQLFFYWGARVADVGDITNPIGIDGAAVGCLVGELSETTVDLFYVYPGSTFATGRDNVAVCVETHGNVAGLGVNASETWKPGGWTEPDVCGGPSQVGTGGASSPLYVMDPTALGTISAWTAHGSIQYRTIDR